MKYGLFALLLVALPGVVHADQLRVTSYDMDDLGGSVHLESDAPVGEPWVRVEGRLVRIWFPHIVQVSRFDHEREASEAIHALALRTGPSDTAVLRIELGSPPRPVTREDIAITRNGPEATVTLRLPRPTVAAEPGAVARPGAQQREPEPLPLAAQPIARAQPPVAAAAAPLLNAPLTAAEPKADDNPLGALRDEHDKSSHPILWLVVASVVLGGIYLALTRMNKKKPISSSIEVLGTRRLGHRQELLIVRALGSDHLLLCTGGKAECVASTPTATDLPLEPAHDPDPESKPDSQAGGIGIISRLSSQHRLRKLLDSVDSETAEPEPEETSRFSHELYSASARKRNAPLHSLAAPAAGRQSDAVAGITRLRQRKSS